MFRGFGITTCSCARFPPPHSCICISLYIYLFIPVCLSLLNILFVYHACFFLDRFPFLLLFFFFLPYRRPSPHSPALRGVGFTTGAASFSLCGVVGIANKRSRRNQGAEFSSAVTMLQFAPHLTPRAQQIGALIKPSLDPEFFYFCFLNCELIINDFNRGFNCCTCLKVWSCISVQRLNQDYKVAITFLVLHSTHIPITIK